MACVPILWIFVSTMNSQRSLKRKNLEQLTLNSLQMRYVREEEILKLATRIYLCSALKKKKKWWRKGRWDLLNLFFSLKVFYLSFLQNPVGIIPSIAFSSDLHRKKCDFFFPFHLIPYPKVLEWKPELNNFWIFSFFVLLFIFIYLFS